MPASSPVFDVDFSLAMHNRTGKYFIGRDLLECASDMLGQTYYWRFARTELPRGLWAKLICRVQGTQIRWNARGGLFGRQVRATPPRPLLHLEPYTVLATTLRREDAVLVHDVGPVTHPELFEARLYPAYRRIFDEIAEIGPHLVFVSIASQREFERAYPHCRPASSIVVYPAIRTDVVAAAREPVAGVGTPFLLTTGSLGNRKNQARSIAAFAQSGLAQRGVRYVLCGAQEPGFEAVAAMAQATAGVVLLPYVSNAQLAWLYANASGFVLASLLEGFGIPLAEAIEYGAVPLVTAGSVLEEVGGPGVLACDPLSIDSIASGMIGLVDMDDTEKSARLTQLRAAITRFTLEKFRRDWRAALATMASAND